jgi:hypothetical protein
MELADFVRQQGIPFVIVGDFNNEVEELAPAGLPKYLTAVWRRPKGAVPGGHRPIDSALVSQSLEALLDVDWDPKTPWAQPHSGFVVRVARKALTLEVVELQSPFSYNAAMGPDLPWDQHACREGGAIAEGLRQAAVLRKDLFDPNETVDTLYTEFCVVAESVQASRQGVELEHQEIRRGWPVGVRSRPLLPPRPQGWVSRNDGLPTWRALYNRVTNYNGVISRGRWAPVDEAAAAVHEQLGKVRVLARALPAEDGVISSIAEIRVGVKSPQPFGEAQLKLRDLLRALERHHVQAGRRRFQEWVKASLTAGAGALHRMARDWGQPLQELATEVDGEGVPPSQSHGCCQL